MDAAILIDEIVTRAARAAVAEAEPRLRALLEEALATSGATDTGLSTREAARVLGVSTGTLELWRRNSAGPPYVRIGRRIVYRATELRSWMDEHREAGR